MALYETRFSSDDDDAEIDRLIDSGVACAADARDMVLGDPEVENEFAGTSLANDGSKLEWAGVMGPDYHGDPRYGYGPNNEAYNLSADVPPAPADSKPFQMVKAAFLETYHANR